MAAITATPDLFEPLKSLFRPKLSSVLGQFTSALQKLDEVIAYEVKRSVDSKKAIEKHTAKIARADETTARAVAVKKNLQALLGQ